MTVGPQKLLFPCEASDGRSGSHGSSSWDPVQSRSATGKNWLSECWRADYVETVDMRAIGFPKMPATILRRGVSQPH
jgi:hypothetical protein